MSTYLYKQPEKPEEETPIPFGRKLAVIIVILAIALLIGYAVYYAFSRPDHQTSDQTKAVSTSTDATSFEESTEEATSVYAALLASEDLLWLTDAGPIEPDLLPGLMATQ